MQNLDDVVHICYEQNQCAEATVTCLQSGLEDEDKYRSKTKEKELD